MNRRRLYRCRHDQRLAGVASGIAEYFDLDVSLVRVLWVLSIFVGGMGILLYIALAIIVPLEPEFVPQPGAEAGGASLEAMTGAEGDSSGAGAASGASGATGASPTGWHTGAVPYRHGTGGGFGATFFGMLLILFGALALIDAYLPAWADNGRFLWPAFILSVGALLVVTAVRRRPNEQ